MFGGGVNMREGQIYIKNIKNQKKITLSLWGIVTQKGGLYPPPSRGV